MPRSARIGRDQIVEVAIRIVDRDGLTGLTMKRIGRELGVEAMSLYRYVPNKDALLVAIAEELIGRVDVSPAVDGDDWEALTRSALQSVRDLARAHPNLFLLMLDRAPHSRTEARLIEDFVGMMRAAGLDGPTALGVFRVVSDYAIGFALAELRGFALEPGRSSIGPDTLPGEDFPEIARLRPVLMDSDHDRDFAFGLELLFASIRGLIANSRSAESPASEETAERSTRHP